MLSYGRQSISAEDVAAVAAVLAGDWLTTGPAVDQFEAALSQLAGGLPVVTTTSGTAALHVAYAAIGLGPGDEVVTTPMTFVATASAASLFGAKIVFADIEPDSGLIDPAAVAASVTGRTKAITAVDYAGQPADYEALRPVAQSVGAVLLADAAHAIGGSDRGRPVGGLADVTAFSFFPTKNITSGEGGAVVCRDPALARRAREFHNIGLVRDPERFRLADQGPWHQEVQAFGLNYRLSDIACALGLSQLNRLAAFKRRRGQIVARYNAALGELPSVATPPLRPGVDPVWHLYPLRVLEGRRRQVYERLRADGIGVQVNYLPVYWHPVYADQGYRRGLCPQAEAFYAQELSLPLHPGLSDDQVDQVVEAVAEALR
ncbi:MAG: DegT/DnrJ/EryC1/StrS family aminotransferase [Propionibacteriaceae bacterium]|jgi:dTDP-4-amino-4,6-dideoxygalactose transaminase|nr:DegT/DnrJ/EryC1/StrS family aminotransferase [Propionibacteriaceae bacterium]